MKFAKICRNLRELDGVDKFEYLFSIAKKNEGISNDDKTDLNRIFGCTSTAYLIVKQHDPVQIITDSEKAYSLYEQLIMKREQAIQAKMQELLFVNYSKEDARNIAEKETPEIELKELTFEDLVKQGQITIVQISSKKV